MKSSRDAPARPARPRSPAAAGGAARPRPRARAGGRRACSGPGDGAALHFPLRAAVWEAYRSGELPAWNPAIFLGTPLLAAYRPGAFYPADGRAGAAAAVHRLPGPGARARWPRAGAAGLPVRAPAGRASAWAPSWPGCASRSGPYLVGHLGDTATVVAAPLLPLLLLAAEAHVNARHARARGRGPRGRAGAAAARGLARGGARRGRPARRAGSWSRHLLAGRRARRGRCRASLAVAAGARCWPRPSSLPTLLAAREAGRAGDRPRRRRTRRCPGVFGLVLRYASHTPAPALALAALPLALTQTPVRVLGVALPRRLGLQWGRGPLAAPGALALVFDLTLCVLAGLSLSAQWRARREPRGRAAARATSSCASLASAAALSVAAAALGPAARRPWPARWACSP